MSPGGYKTQTIRVTNNGKKAQTFQVGFGSFSSPGIKGKTTIDSTMNEHSCAEWLSASPSFFELEPGATQEVEVLLQVPNTQDANNVRWALTMVKLARENAGNQDKGENVVAMEIIHTFQFLIHVFQTPPSISFKQATINSFKVDTSSIDSVSTVKLLMQVQNTGDAIIDCSGYVDLFNAKTGEEIRVRAPKGFTVLPGGIREVIYILPADLTKGTYNVLGIVDYGSDTDIAGFEIQVVIQ